MTHPTWLERVAARAGVDPSLAVLLCASMREEPLCGPMHAAACNKAGAVRSINPDLDSPLRVPAAFEGALQGALDEHASVAKARARTSRRPPGFGG